jgi:hypothetical protein
MHGAERRIRYRAQESWLRRVHYASACEQLRARVDECGASPGLDIVLFAMVLGSDGHRRCSGDALTPYLAAGGGIVVQHDDLAAVVRGYSGGGHAGWPGAYDKHFSMLRT